MQTCPYCMVEIHLRELPHQGGCFENLRICPSCGKKITVDADTKRRQFFFILTLFISTGSTVLLYFVGLKWLFPTLFSYIILALQFYWGSKKLFLVPYSNDQDSHNDT